MKTGNSHNKINQQQIVIIPVQKNKKKLTTKIKNIMKKIKVMFRVLIVCSLLISTGKVLGQVNRLDEVVYLKNGGIIRGAILEQVPDKYVKIQTQDGSIFVYQSGEIEKITRETCLGGGKYYRARPHRIKEPRVAREHYRPHYEFISEGGYFFGVGNISPADASGNEFDLFGQSGANSIKNMDAGYSLRTVHGIALSNNFTVGLGIGADFYRNATFMPLTVDTRICIGKSSIRPYFDFGVGYSVPLDAPAGGLTLIGGLGIKAGSNWAFSFSLRTQSGVFDITDANGEKSQFKGTGKYLAISTSYYF
jgi:hypothetical protein